MILVWIYNEEIEEVLLDAEFQIDALENLIFVNREYIEVV
jgi:hypothetical protein